MRAMLADTVLLVATTAQAAGTRISPVV